MPKAWTFPENNNRIIEAQKQGGDPSLPGPVKLDFFGHAAFRITTPLGTSLLIDPWRNDPSGSCGVWFPKEFPELYVDIVTSTHAHFDHDELYRPHAPMVLDRPAGEFVLSDLSVTALADKHQFEAPGWFKWHDAIYEFNWDPKPPNNPMQLDNVILVIETGGLRIAHWGDNRNRPAEHVTKAITGVDVLLLPIDQSMHILSYEQVEHITNALAPKVIVPCHYHIKGVNSVLSTLGTADEWVDRQRDVLRVTEGTIMLKPEEVAHWATKVIYFGGHFVSA